MLLFILRVLTFAILSGILLLGGAILSHFFNPYVAIPCAAVTTGFIITGSYMLWEG